MIGVYRITNTVDGKVYIGSTTDDIEKRWSCHRTSLKSGKHHNKHLQRAWNKYGENAFVFEVIEITDNKENTRNKERSWISKFFGKNCYNATKEAAGRPAKFTKAEIRECIESALEQGITRSSKLEEYVRNTLGNEVRKETISDIMHELGYINRPLWAKVK